MQYKKEDYAELTVSGKPRKANIGQIVLMIVMVLAGCYVVLLVNAQIPVKWSMLGSLLIVAYVCAAVWLLSSVCRTKKVDYDYLYVDNDLEIDEVYNQTRRRHMVTVHLEHAKCIAPVGSQSLLGYEGQGIAKTRDFTSGREDATPYAIVVEKDGRLVELLIEEDEHMLSLMQQRNKAIFDTRGQHG